MNDWDEIARHIGSASGEPFRPDSRRDIGGGCINRALQLSDGKRSFFIKLNACALLGMFAAEAAGLDEMAGAGAIRVPRPVCKGTSGDNAYLVMEYIELGGAGDPQKAGAQLAQLHRHTAGLFGWRLDNTIGATAQHNSPSNDWIAFWRDRRLAYQLHLAAANGHGGALQARGERLIELFPSLIDHRPSPSLIHGDLWGGNISYDSQGNPVIYDPAVYYADREAEIAMTELFGGFGAGFYAAYSEAWPLDPGYPTRRELYNLYHILNHLNLFGGGYAGQALGMINRLLAELGH